MKDFEDSSSSAEKSNLLYSKNSSHSRADLDNSGENSPKIVPDSITLQDFKILKFIAQGTFGRVFLAYLPKDNKHFAIKCISKDNLIED